jgi:small subunit ribosomal protein S8e
MVIWKDRRQGKKPSGGKYWPYRKKRLAEIGSNPTLTRVGKLVRKEKRTRGGGKINRLISVDVANLKLGTTFKKSKIKLVKENPANRNFARMNVITKGAIIETEDGLAKVTSKPSKDGVVNAVLIKSNV